MITEKIRVKTAQRLLLPQWPPQLLRRYEQPKDELKHSLLTRYSMQPTGMTCAFSTRPCCCALGQPGRLFANGAAVTIAVSGA
jgi:hypothetical protein